MTDLLVRREGALLLVEVKAGRDKWGAGQRKRLAEVAHQLAVEPSFMGPDGVKHRIIRSQVPLRTHWQQAEQAVARAFQQGVAGWAPNPGVALLFVAPFHSSGMSSEEEVEALFEAARVEIRGTYRTPVSRITGHSLEYPFRRSRSVPLSILPLPADQVGEFVAGELWFTVEVSADYVAECLQAVGLGANVVIPKSQCENLSRSCPKWTELGYSCARPLGVKVVAGHVRSSRQ